MTDKKLKYNNQYCKIHDQHFADFLTKGCPICLGEKLEELKIAQQPNIMEAMKSMEDKGV
jgi:hypothetical protein